MRLRSLLFVAMTLAASTAIAQQTKAPAKSAAPPPNDPKVVRDKFSYSFGMMIGKNLKKQAIDVNADLIMQGFKDAITGGKTLLTEQQAMEAIQVFEQEMAAKQQREAQAFLAANIKKPGVKTTKTGLQYKVVKAGKGPRPTLNDSVVVNYRGTFPNGAEFDSSGDKPFQIPVSEVIAGWQEALQMMEVGSRWELVIPPDLAYGAEGQPPIGPNATLIFDLELVQIAKPPVSGQAPKNPVR